MEVNMKQHAKFLTLAFGFLFVLVLTGFAQQQSEESVICAVGGEVMKKSDAKITYEYKGKTYYFCCQQCKEAFVKNPEEYLQKKDQETQRHAHKKAEDTSIDPVCGMKMKTSEAKATYDYNGKTYYFCQDECKEKFVKNPEEYVKKAEEVVTCPVSGKKMKKSEAADSYNHNGETYYFCCAACKDKFLADPEKYTKKKDDMQGEDSSCCIIKK